MKQLIEIQQKLKAPKGQFNKFGGYKYRSCEDIIEAAKPIYTALGCHLTCTDEIKERPDKPDLLVTTVRLENSEGCVIEVQGLGAIDYEKKGMDYSQAIGAASSYARKYALNGLFAIDDTKDADATNTHGKEVAPQPAPAQPQPQEAPTNGNYQPAVPEDVEIAIHQCATRAELIKLMNSQKGWLESPAIRAMANEYYKELKS